MTSTEFIPAVLVLADGRIFRGRGFGATGTTLGEAVFTTAMTGYQESLTDPSHHRQLLVSAAPHIGNTGWNDEDSSSRDGKVWAAGLVIRDLTRRVSNWRSERSLTDELEAQSIIGIHSVDTRAIVRHLSEHGSTLAGIFSGEDADKSDEELVEIVAGQPSMAGADLTADVTTGETYTVAAAGEKKHTVVAYDLGLTFGTLRQFADRGIETVVVPAGTPLDDVREHRPDGLFLSAGPGDPAAADAMVQIARDAIAADIPLFGTGLGHQILGRALGKNTYKMDSGHRGLNVPVRNHLTGRIDITAQNHGFALEGTPEEKFDTDFGPAAVTHSCLNDDTVEGVALDSGMAFAVQHRPETSVDPDGSTPLFTHFVELLANHSPNRK